jgi:signal transduction histidine kinase
MGAARYPRQMSPIAHPPADRARPFPPLVLIFAAWLVPALLSGFDTYMQSRLEAHPPDWHWVFFNSVDWLLYAVLTPFVFRASRRLPLQPPHLARNIALHVAGALGMCVAWAGLGTLLRLAIFPMPPDLTGQKVLREFAGWVFTTLPFGVGVYFALVGIEHSLFYFAQARERETQAARLAAQLAEARLGALRMQLNPHFLFNSLNAITVLVRDQNTAAASRMLGLLSDVLRQVLRAEPTHETTLASELEFLERYLAIEQVRFSDRLRPSIEVDSAIAGAAVPRFLLQPLVENALRHGIAKRADAGVLHVSAHRDGANLVLTVRDDGPGLMPGAPSPGGVGLANTRARLAALYGERASLDIANAAGGGVVATVRLPYHEAETDASSRDPYSGEDPHFGGG